MQRVADSMYKNMGIALKSNNYDSFDRTYNAGAMLLYYATWWNIELN